MDAALIPLIILMCYLLIVANTFLEKISETLKEVLEHLKLQTREK